MQASLMPSRELEMRRNPAGSPGRSVGNLPVVRPDPQRVAVLLNRNARQVKDGLARRVASIVGRENLYYSRSLEEAEAFAREIVQRGYGTVVSGGGDGTLVRTVNLVQHYVDESNRWRQERHRRFGERQSLLGSPRFGFLRLGTGNGIADVVGAKKPLADLERMLEHGTSRNVQLPLMEVDDERCFFAGLGYDSLLLNDYNWLKNRTHNPLLKPFMHTVLGYFAALFARTLPNVMFHGAARIEARVKNLGPAFYIDPRRGDAVCSIEAGTTLFEGPAAIIGAGTAPFYGYGFKVFPFAGMMPGAMNLRVAQLGPIETLSHLPSLWRGSYRNGRRLFDFFVTDVEIELSQPYPFQHSGDAQGMRKQLRWRIAKEPLELVDLHAAHSFQD